MPGRSHPAAIIEKKVIFWVLTEAAMSMASHDSNKYDQPEITIVNLDSETNPTIFRSSHNDISSPTLVKLAHFLDAEGAVIVNLSL
ncbi:hypothetical protein PILCRDRAFT_825069 [Piloderma croceum F 1598]|uniref:Uncharacterized protein n=1 Tax=Piloderma croceum (strain F 1598) TaxID=765440 RepID=A0A0C3FDK4_PILCF|nr:hypothetical protein PILCRDRAFT_825069 [Piloderma croceum F 1598]